jgi:hypothetical protein
MVSSCEHLSIGGHLCSVYRKCRPPAPALQINLVWLPSTGVTREEIPPIPEEIAALRAAGVGGA